MTYSSEKKARPSPKMESAAVLKITPGMSEEEILQVCAEAALENSSGEIQKQLDQVVEEHGCLSALDLIKTTMKEEREQYDTL